MEVDPDALLDYLRGFESRVLVLHYFSPSGISPEPFTASVRMLAQGSCTYREL